MLVRRGERTDLAAPTKADPADDVVWRDYYTRQPQIRLTGDPAGHPTAPGQATEVMLDGNDIAAVVECAVRHPNVNMRSAVLAAVWNHPDSFRQIFQFGLNAPAAFAEIRNIVAEELANCAATADASAPSGSKTLLPRMPMPAHLRDRRR